MSKVDTYDYRYRVCPHCKSKRVKKRQLSDLNSGCSEVQGVICLNCDRFSTEFKYIYDRAEILRDIKKLNKFLTE